MLGIVFNPRMRYLTGLGAVPVRRRRGLPTSAKRRLQGLGAYNPRMRYLTGYRLGDDSVTAADLDELSQPAGPDMTATLPIDYSTTGVESGQILSPTDYNITGPIYSPTDIVSASNPPATAPGTINPATGLVSTQSVGTGVPTSFFSQTSALGVSNGTALIGLAALVLLAALGSN